MLGYLKAIDRKLEMAILQASDDVEQFTTRVCAILKGVLALIHLLLSGKMRWNVSCLSFN